MAPTDRPPLVPADRAHPYTFAELDALLAGRRYTFADLTTELILIVPPVTAMAYLRDLAARGALVRDGDPGTADAPAGYLIAQPTDEASCTSCVRMTASSVIAMRP